MHGENIKIRLVNKVEGTKANLGISSQVMAVS